MTRKTEASVVSFDRRPHDAEIIRQRHQQHGEHQQRRQAVIHAQFGDRAVAAVLAIERAGAFVFAKVADRIDRAHQRHRRVQQDDQRTQRIGVEEAIPQGDAAGAQHLRRHRERQQKRQREGREVDGLQYRAPARHGRERARRRAEPPTEEPAIIRAVSASG